MKVYFGGHMPDDLQGDLAAVIGRERVRRASQATYDLAEEFQVFVDPINSDNFKYITGLWALRNVIDRVYIGISQETGTRIQEEVRKNGWDKNHYALRSIDEWLVRGDILHSYEHNAPDQIVLKLTDDGNYKISTQK